MKVLEGTILVEDFKGAESIRKNIIEENNSGFNH